MQQMRGSVAQHFTPKGVNWNLEEVSNMVRKKSEKQDSFMYKKEGGGDVSPPADDYRVLQ